MRIADVVAETLAAHDIRHAFGMPGGEVITLVDALGKAGISFVLARQETSAAIMAAGAHAISNAPGLLVTTVGPGLANALNGIADASQEHVPLIVISGVVDHDVRGRYTHQVLDQVALVRPLVKGSFEIEAEGAGAVVARAIALAIAHPMGPVHLDLAPGTAEKLAQASDAVVPPTSLRVPSVSSDDATLSKVANKLRGAKRPVMLVGYEAVQAGVAGAVTKLAEAHGCPVLTTYKAKGIISEDHALSLGAVGLSPLADKIVLAFLRQADVALLVGFDPIELRQGWLIPFADTTDTIEFTISQSDHGMFRCGTCVMAPLSVSMPALAAIGGGAKSAKWADDAIGKTRALLKKGFAAPTPWGPHAAIETLQAAMPKGAVVTVDSGAHRILLSQMLRVIQPRGLMQSAGFCTMGAAVPLAIGARIADPTRPVIAVLGDGGMEMCLGELATLRDSGQAITIVVFQDESLALIELKQQKAGLQSAGVRLGRTPFEDIATAFGGYGARVMSTKGLHDALLAAQKREKFSLIVCEIEAAAYVDRI